MGTNYSEDIILLYILFITVKEIISLAMYAWVPKTIKWEILERAGIYFKEYTDIFNNKQEAL